MDVPSRPRSLAGKQVSRAFSRVKISLKLTLDEGSRCCWTRSADCTMGQSIWPARPANRPDPVDTRRYLRREFKASTPCTFHLCSMTWLLLDFQRTRYLNAVNTLTELLSMGVVPIVNENDTISVSVRSIPSSSYSQDAGLISSMARKSNLATMTHSRP